MKRQIAKILCVGLLILGGYSVASAAPVYLADGTLPMWSPDGAKIAYGNHQIYTINKDGTARLQLTNITAHPNLGERNAWGPQYRPGSNQLYYMDQDYDLTSAVYSRLNWIDIGGTGQGGVVQSFSAFEYVSPVRFSRFGSHYTYMYEYDMSGSSLFSGPEIRIASVNGGFQIVKNSYMGLDYIKHTLGGVVTWRTGASSDKLAYTKHINASDDGIWSIYTVNTDSTGETRITDSAFGDVFSWINWSPDGNTLIFSYLSDIWTLGLIDDQLTQITNDAYNDNYAVFSPDGLSIAYTSIRDGQSEIYLLDLDADPDPVPEPTTMLLLGLGLMGLAGMRRKLQK